MRVAVVGHLEWVQFARVERVPEAGEIVHALESWEEPGGGGAVAAVALARLAGEATFFCALGDDELARRSHAELERRGVRVRAAQRSAPQRRVFTFLDAAGERTITVLGPRMGPLGADPLPWEELAQADAVYFCAGDVAALRAARAARVLVASPRPREVLREASVALDALVHSVRDVHEQLEPDELEPRPRWLVSTDGVRGGRYRAAGGAGGSYAAASPPGALVDCYGCGDSFAAGLTYALGAGSSIEAALELGARCGAECVTGRGPYGAPLTPPDPE